MIARGAQAAQADDEIAQGGQVAGAVAGAGGAQIFAEGDIPHVVDRFDGPVAAAQGLQLGRIHFVGGAAAQEDFGFLAHAQRFEVVGGADNDRGLGGVGKAGLLGSNGKGIDLAAFMPAVPLVQRDVRRGKKRPPGPGTGGPVCGRGWVGFL